ncbi:MAG: fibrobacter succinogenes major paralogous domain-containing protein, partial [Bacteroidales bacterium]
QGQTLSHDGSRWVVHGTILVTDSSVNIVPTAGHDAAKPIFAVLNSNGQVVFAVYETGVRSYVGSESAKGVKGGFAVGGLSGTKGGAPEYFSVTPDSTRVYIDNSTKGVKGGFAVGGLSGTKGTVEYLRITPDSARIYIDNSSTKGVKGGFAVGGLSRTKGTGSNYFTVTQDSTFISNTIFAEGNMLLTGNVTTSVGVTDTPLTDIEGNTYKTVKIGTQVWMAENIRTSTYADGTPIGTDAMVYNNSLSADTLKNYGMLYSDTAVVSAFNVCPDGWHVPSVTEWEILFINVVGVDWNSNSYELGQKLSEPGLVSESSGFWNYDFNQTNTTGFSARPAGYAYNSAGWYFSGIGEYASFWTFDVYMTQVISIDGYSGSVNTQEVGAPVAYPVRCVKNQ